MAPTRNRARSKPESHHPTPPNGGPPSAPLGKVEEEAKLAPQTFIELYHKAEAGDGDALKQLTPHLADKVEALIEAVGLTTQVRSAITRRIGKHTRLVTQHVWQEESKLLAKTIAGPAPSPLEALLAEQVSITYMALRMAEFALEATGETSFKDAYWLQSRVDSANSRFLAAIRTLAQVRRLQIPNLLQVNIAEQQVNVTPVA